jgi:recombination protein RecR
MPTGKYDDFMGETSESLRRLCEEFEKLPSIGAKTAERLAYFLLKSSRGDALKLAEAIIALKDKARHCSVCYNVTEIDPCRICSDERRDRAVVCVVEEPADVDRIEDSGVFSGLYHVLLGQVSPLDGMRPDSLTLGALVERVKTGKLREAIIATNPTVEGDATALAVKDALSSTGIVVTRIARGIPSGSSLEYTNKTIIADAIEGRSAFGPRGGKRP